MRSHVPLPNGEGQINEHDVSCERVLLLAFTCWPLTPRFWPPPARGWSCGSSSFTSRNRIPKDFDNFINVCQDHWKLSLFLPFLGLLLQNVSIVIRRSRMWPLAWTTRLMTIKNIALKASLTIIVDDQGTLVDSLFDNQEYYFGRFVDNQEHYSGRV